MCICLTLFSFSPASSLSEFDQLLDSLNTWCEEQGAGSRALPKVKEVIAMRDSGTQRWVRGRVTRQISDRYVVSSLSLGSLPSCSWGGVFLVFLVFGILTFLLLRGGGGGCGIFLCVEAQLPLNFGEPLPSCS